MNKRFRELNSRQDFNNDWICDPKCIVSIIKPHKNKKSGDGVGLHRKADSMKLRHFF